MAVLIGKGKDSSHHAHDAFMSNAKLGVRDTVAGLAEVENEVIARHRRRTGKGSGLCVGIKATLQFRNGQWTRVRESSHFDAATGKHVSMA